MPMATRNTQLLNLIAGRSSAAQPVKPASVPPATLSGLLRASLRKQAQYLGEASRRQHAYAQSAADAEARKRQAAAAAAEAAARREESMRDTKAYTAKLQEEYFRSRKDLVQPKDQATVDGEMAARGPTRSWGDNKYLRKAMGAITNNLYLTTGAVGSLALAGSNLLSGRGNLIEEQKHYWRGLRQDQDDVAHDTLNNIQMQVAGARKGIGTLGRAVNHYARPSTYRNDIASRAAAWSRKNEWANANLEHNARVGGIVRNFRDSDLANPDASTMGKVNRFVNDNYGQLAGAEIATAGVGGIAGLAGKGITHGTRVLSSAVRGTQAAGTAARTAGTAARAANTASHATTAGTQAAAAGTQAAGTAARTAGTQAAATGTQAAAAGTQAATTGARLGTRMWQGTREGVARGIDAVGDTIAMPFNAVGNFAAPISTRVQGEVVRAGVLRPARDIYELIRHPVVHGRYIAAHPWQAAGRFASYPVRWAWGTARPVARMPFGGNGILDNGFKAWTAANTYRDVADGRYGDALWELGGMGVYGALGPKSLIPMAGYGAYRTMEALDAAEAEQAAQGKEGY